MGRAAWGGHHGTGGKHNLLPIGPVAVLGHHHGDHGVAHLQAAGHAGANLIDNAGHVHSEQFVPNAVVPPIGVGSL